MNTNESKHYNIDDFKSIIKTLRGVNGCPWDKAQTHETLKPCIIDETYEVIEAINNNDDDNLKEELGDVLLQVVMHSQIAQERDAFSFEDVVDAISRKMIRRHPHVFPDKNGNVTEMKDGDWEKIKKQEKEDRNESVDKKSELQRIPKSLPALIRAQKVLHKSEKLYGSGNNLSKSIQLIKNNLNEIENCSKKNVENEKNIDKINNLMGENILEMVNITSVFRENAENSLTKAVEQFINKREGNY